MQIYEREVTHQLDNLLGNNVSETHPKIKEFCMAFVKCITASAMRNKFFSVFLMI